MKQVTNGSPTVAPPLPDASQASASSLVTRRLLLHGTRVNTRELRLWLIAWRYARILSPSARHPRQRTTFPTLSIKRRSGRERRKNHERLRCGLTCATTETDETPTVGARRERSRTFEVRAANFTRRVACRGYTCCTSCTFCTFPRSKRQIVRVFIYVQIDFDG